MQRLTLRSALLLLSFESVAFAAGLRVFPAEVHLTGLRARQRLIVLAEEARQQFTGDLTSRAKFNVIWTFSCSFNGSGWAGLRTPSL